MGRHDFRTPDCRNRDKLKLSYTMPNFGEHPRRFFGRSRKIPNLSGYFAFLRILRIILVKSRTLTKADGGRGGAGGGGW